jgi:cell division protein FtsB
MSESQESVPEPARTAVRQAPPRARRRLEAVREQRDLRRRLWVWGLTLGLVVLMVNAVVGENGYLATLKARAEKAGLEAALAHVRYENIRLQEAAAGLTSDPAVLEEEARRALGLMRPGEVVIILRDAAPDVHPPAVSGK